LGAIGWQRGAGGGCWLWLLTLGGVLATSESFTADDDAGAGG